jgi:hypothetical protein
MLFPPSSRKLRSVRCENTLAGTFRSWFCPRYRNSRLFRPVHVIRGNENQAHSDSVLGFSSSKTWNLHTWTNKCRMSLPHFIPNTSMFILAFLKYISFKFFGLITASIIFVTYFSYNRTPFALRVIKSRRTGVGCRVAWRDVSSSSANFGFVYLLCFHNKVNGFRPRMFVATNLFESQIYIYIYLYTYLKLDFVIKLRYYSIHHHVSFITAVSSVGQYYNGE